MNVFIFLSNVCFECETFLLHIKNISFYRQLLKQFIKYVLCVPNLFQISEYFEKLKFEFSRFNCICLGTRNCVP